MRYRLFLLSFLLVSILSTNLDAQIEYSFYAVYHRLLDSETEDFTVDDFVLSGNGNTLVIKGTDLLYGNPVIYTLNRDGTNKQAVNLPEGVTEIKSLAIDSSGSAIFFYASPVIYRVTGETASPVFNIQEGTSYADCYTQTVIFENRISRINTLL